MPEAPFAPTEGERAQLRIVIGEIERELSCLGREAPVAEHRMAVSSLVTSWSRLVELMAIGAAPVVRLCPSCGYRAMHPATLCGRCWITLAPIAADEPADG